LRGRLGRRRHGRQNTGMAAGVKPRSREAVRVSAQGFRRDDSPGDDECGVLGGAGMVRWWSVVVRSHAALIAVSCRPFREMADATAGVHCGTWRCGGVAARSTGAAAGDAGDRVPRHSIRWTPIGEGVMDRRQFLLAVPCGALLRSHRCATSSGCSWRHAGSGSLSDLLPFRRPTGR
jgi:hypothetical protein